MLSLSKTTLCETLPTVTVIAFKDIPYTEDINGYHLLNNYRGTFKEKVQLLACYIHTQSVGNYSEKSLGDKFAIAQVINTRLKYGYDNNHNLAKYLKKHSRTVRERKSRYFWIKSNDYYSRQCIIAAYNVLKGNIPKDFDVGLATRFFTEKDKVRPKKHHKYIKSFRHDFYVSEHFITKYVEKN